MWRLILSEFDLSELLISEGKIHSPLFCVKQKVGFVFSAKGLESYCFGDDMEKIASTLEKGLQTSKLPDQKVTFSTVLTQLEYLKGKSFCARKILVVPKDSRIHGIDSTFSLLKKWAEMTLENLEFSHPHYRDFWKSLSIQDAVNTITRFQQIPEFLNPQLEAFHNACIHSQKKPRLLLHVCCGPDAAGVISQLKKDYDLHCFWYDPNIQPYEEYQLRLQAFQKVASIEQVSYTVGEYDVERFLKTIEGLEYSAEKGAKCTLCYDLRLERAAFEAANHGFDTYTTTLAISPHKVQEKLRNFGALYEKKYRVPYLARNFLKHEGFKDSVQYTREHGIYRQDYCGCYYSLWEGGLIAQQQAQNWGFLPPERITQDETSQ